MLAIPYEVLALGAVILGLLYYRMMSTFDYWKKRGVKHDPPLPIVGNSFDAVIMKRNNGTIITDLYYKYKNEKVIGIYNFQYPALIVKDPELITKIWTTDFHSFAQNEAALDDNMDKIMRKNLFMQKYEEWKKNRQMLSPAFTANKVKSWFDSVDQVGSLLPTYLEKHPEELNAKELMARYTSDIVATVGLGIQAGALEKDDSSILQMGKIIFDPSFFRGIRQILLLLFPRLSSFFGIKFIPVEVGNFFNHILHDVIMDRDKNYDATRKDMMQHWIDLKKKSLEVVKGNVKSDVITREFDNDDILGGCISFFLEAYETTSMVTSFILWHLAMDKDLQDRVKAEVDEVLNANGGKFTYEGMLETPYTQNVILETLRLHPAIHAASKVCTKSYNMDIGNGKTLLVEEGTTVIVPNLGLGTDPQYWEDAEKFDPDRHLINSDRPKGVFTPFGEGPRICIGMRLGVLMIKLGIFHIVKEFEVIPSKNTTAKIVQDPTHFMSAHKDGLKMKFVKRTSSK